MSIRCFVWAKDVIEQQDWGSSTYISKEIWEELNKPIWKEKGQSFWYQSPRTQKQQNVPIYIITKGSHNQHEAHEKSWREVKLHMKTKENV